MKTKFKCFGKSTLSLVLAVMMMVSCVFVGNSETVKDVETSDEITVKVPNAEINDDAAEAINLDDAADETASEKLDEITGESETTQKTDSTPVASTTSTQKKVYQASGATSYTFYFDKPNAWTNTPKIHVRDSSKSILTSTSWDTRPNMEWDSNVSLFKYTFSTDATPYQVLFTNGTSFENKNQTNYINSITNGAVYTPAADTGVSPSVYNATSNVVYFNNSSSWSGNIYCYAYSSSNGSDLKNADWPGQKMTLVSGSIYGLPDKSKLRLENNEK